jgi:hypothetical protein
VAGYLALAGAHERAKEYKDALKVIQDWRERNPGELNGVQALIRIRAEDSQVNEAAKEAEDIIKDLVKKAGDGQKEWAQKNPVEEKDPAKAKEEEERRAKALADNLNSLELVLVLKVADAFQEAKAYAEAEKWLTERALPLIGKQGEANREGNTIALQALRAGITLQQARAFKEGSRERQALVDKAIEDYAKVWKAREGDAVTGNNLAWLLVKEKNEPARALGIMEKVRAGRYSGKPVSGERLNLEILDTLGVVYRANKMNQESLNLFKEAMARYSREPRVLMHLAQSQKAMGLNNEAYRNFRDAINRAGDVLKTTADADRKEKLTQLMAEADREMKAIGIAGGP